MKLTAYTIEGVNDVWESWEEVESWRLEGPKLLIRQREAGQPTIKAVDLPGHVIGLADDATTHVVASSDSASREVRRTSHGQQTGRR